MAAAATTTNTTSASASPAVNPTFFNLTWRQKVSKAELLSKLETFISAFDSSSKMEVSSVTSQAKKLTSPEESGHAAHMVLQKIVTTVRRYKNGHNASASMTEKYIARMRTMAEHLLTVVEAEESVTRRDLYYRLHNNNFSRAQLEKCADDLSLTLKVHPASLGVLPERKSFVRMPAGIDLRVEEVKNVFAYNKSNTVHATTYSGGDYISIAAMYLTIRVSRQDTPIRGVVVVEHRSVKEKLEQHLDQPGYRGIILVMTAGFPDAACREFLHLLSVDKEFRDVPFIWASDCDAHSISMYGIIKYGSSGQAYASPSMVCHQITFGGLTKDHLVAFAQKLPEIYRQSLLRQQPTLSDANQQAETVKKQVEVSNRLRIIEAKTTSVINDGDKKRLRGLEKAGFLWLQGEEEALAEYHRLKAEGAKISFLELDGFGSYGCARYMAEAVSSLRGESFVAAPLFGDFTEARAAWVGAVAQPATAEQVDMDVTMIDI